MSEFYLEMGNQSNALRNTLEYYLPDHPGFTLLLKAQNYLHQHDLRHVLYTGMGSSFYHSYLPYYYLNSRGISCDMRDTSEILSYQDKFIVGQGKNSLIIGVSQSGESGELINLLQNLKTKNMNQIHLWGITNNVSSTLGQKAQIIYPTIAGIETSVTSKTYVTGCLVQYLLARAIAGENPLPIKLINEINTLIKNISPKIERESGEFYNLAKTIDGFLGPLTFLNFIGHGTAMATIMQATLNIKEIAKIYAEGLTLGMFRHGPIETIFPDFRAIIILNDPISIDLVNSVVSNITGKWGQGRIVLISNHPEAHQQILNERIKLITNPIVNPYLAPIYEIMLLQPYFCLLAEKRGYVPGIFRNTQKITK
jgi:glucosamine--fructose-6-phosphate aminotransferase (isomerizing)